MVSFELDKEIKKDVLCLVANLGQRKSSESPRGIKPQNFGSCSLMTLPLSHRDCMVSEVGYEEVYHEVPFSIPPGDLEFFLCSTFQTR